MVSNESILLTKDNPLKLRTKNPFIRAGFCLFLFFGLAAISISGIFQVSVSAQQVISETPTASLGGTTSGVYITVTYIEPINVRSGPGSFDYPVIGSLPVGGTAPATGRSPAGEWIQIEYPDGPRGTGWVYAANVSLSPGALLKIVEPPPTATPATTPTLNQTFVAAFQVLPTSTRLPTFTAPPSLVFPTYTNPVHSSSSRAITAWVVVILGLIGILGIVFTSIRRH
jgi:hypothetical protein